MTYAIIRFYTADNYPLLQNHYTIVKIIKKHINGRYVMSFPEINKFNDYLDEYDFSNIIARNMTLNKDSINFMPDTFNELIKFTMPTLIKYYGLATPYNYEQKKEVLSLKKYFDFEKINSDLFKYNMSLLTKNVLTLHHMQFMSQNNNLWLDLNKFQKIDEQNYYLGYEIFKYMKNNFSEYLTLNGWYFGLVNPYIK